MVGGYYQRLSATVVIEIFKETSSSFTSCVHVNRKVANTKNSDSSTSEKSVAIHLTHGRKKLYAVTLSGSCHWGLFQSLNILHTRTF